MPSSSILEEDRQRALDRLTAAFARGAITIEDYEERAGKVQYAHNVTQLAPLLADLPAEIPASTQNARNLPDTRASGSRPVAPRPESRTWLVEERDGGTETVACIMGDRRMTGDWLGGNAVTSFTLMGSTTLDLRNTALPPGKLKIDAFALMGETRIIVPRGLPVKLTALPFMGEARVAESVERRVDRSGSWVEIGGIAMMGSIVVKAAD